MSGLRFEKVSKKFGQIPIIDNLDVYINDGEFFTFVGPSGCGKSTILNMAAGLEEVSEGHIYFGDREVTSLSAKERDVAMVFQNYALYPHMSVYENIAFPLRMRKIEKKNIEAEVNKIAKLLSIPDLLSRKPGEISGGQRQRVALGRALVRHPKVFLLDEPLSNLDAKLRMEMRSELKRLHRELGITMVYVTHDQSEALSLSERMAVLNKGRVEQCGPPEEVYRLPANVFVAGFVGNQPMNLIPGDVALDLFTMDIPSSGKHGRSAVEDYFLGIRPENVQVFEKTANRQKEARVLFVESAGPFNWIDVDMGDGTIIRGRAREGCRFSSGQKCFIYFAVEDTLFFDRISGRRIEAT